MNKPRSLYLHIPFCLSKCRYCDFASAPTDGSTRAAYLSALRREILSLPEGELDTVYFGGGTPSLLTERELAALMGAITLRFHLSNNAEITLEANPKTATQDKLRAFRALGISRLSIGMQSMIPSELAALGRAHSREDFLRTYENARTVGFRSVNVDLMYGIPEQTIETLTETLDALLAVSPDHISAYGLILEEGTPFYSARNTLALPDEDTEFEMYGVVTSRLREAGFCHYEVSNYAISGHECKHNLVYWRQMPYYAAGLAASSFVGGLRRTNTRDMRAYLTDPLSAAAEMVRVEGADAEFEYIMLALRLSEGIDEATFFDRFGVRFRDKYADKLAPYLRAGYLLLTDKRTALTEKGLYVSSALLAELCPD